MLSTLLVRALAISAVCLGGACSAVASGPITVALTLTRHDGQGEAEKLGDNLLDLLALGVQADPLLSIVERRQINLVIQAHVLDRSQPADPQLQLGKLLTADFLVMLETLPADGNSQQPWVRLRVVDAKSAAIRGVTVAALDEGALDEAADQFARYASTVIHSPKQPTVTVAVVPFESQGRFDRLRPLELGIRDLVTARLLELSGAAAASPIEGTGPSVELQHRFQVVQRSNMEQLLAELDLIRSGFADKDRLPEKLPQRAAAYVVRGELNERQADDKYTVIVRGETVQVATLRVVDKFEIECGPAALPVQLAKRVDALAQRLWIDEKIDPPAHVPELFELQSLEQLALKDLRRFFRRTPCDFSTRSFVVPGQRIEPSTLPPVKPATPLGQSLLRKAIDRLESVLFVNPDDALAAYALGFAYSLHGPATYRPERADEFLRKAYSLDPRSELAALALGVLGELAYDDQTAMLSGPPGETAERLWFSFQNMPEKYRDFHWPNTIRCLGELYRHPARNKELADLLSKAAPFATAGGEPFRGEVASFVLGLATQLINQSDDQPEFKEVGLAFLRGWAEADDKLLARRARSGLAEILARQHDYLGAAEAFEASAALIERKDYDSRTSHDYQLARAAENYRLAGQPERALKLLLAFQFEVLDFNDLPRGKRGYEIGASYEALGEKEKALAAYLEAAEDSRGIVDNSDIVERIAKLGGVPLREDRRIDVRYVRSPSNLAYSQRILASDGHRLFLGAEAVMVFDPATEKAEPFGSGPHQITCLQVGDGQLWAGTNSDGLWRCDLGSGGWERACAIAELPEPHVASLAIDGRIAYIGVGTNASGGMVRIDEAGKVRIFNDPGDPPITPTQIVVHGRELVARTERSLNRWSLEAEGLLRRERPPAFSGTIPPRLFPGKDWVWFSSDRHELMPLDGTREQNAVFRSAWYPTGHKSGYRVNFITEHGDDVWFGGQQWEFFVSSGLYRLNRQTGAFCKFTPADGFKTTRLHNTYDGAWIDDRLWLITDAGLCVVTPRPAATSASANSCPGITNRPLEPERQIPNTCSLYGEQFTITFAATDKDVAVLDFYPEVRRIRFEDYERWDRPGSPRDFPFPVTDAGFAHFASCKQLEKLEVYSGHPLQITDDGLKAFEGMTELQMIWIDTHTDFTDAGMAHLAGCTNLETLYIREGKFGDDTLSAVSGLTNLKTLTLPQSSPFSDVGIARLKDLKKLERLHLSSPAVGDPALETLGTLSSLKLLTLSRASITDAGLEHLKPLRLWWLVLAKTPISSTGLAAIKDMTGLEHLTLSDTQIDDTALDTIVGLTQLQELSLSGTHVTDAGVERLIACQQLETLFLERLPLTDRVIDLLLNLKKLKQVWLSDTQVTEAGYGRLVAAGFKGQTAPRVTYVRTAPTVPIPAQFQPQ